jgi:large subunit ribosomal protein L30
MVATLRITQVRSAIGAKPKQRGTLRALGLRRINHTVELPDRPEIRGMVGRVPHLVVVEEVA